VNRPPAESPSRDQVLAALDDGVRGVEEAAAAASDWRAATPCPGWAAVDLAGHLLAVATYYHRLLDAAERGEPLTDRPTGVALGNMNARDLAALGSPTPAGAVGPARIAEYARSARGYHSRLQSAEWDRPIATWQGLGTLTVGEHAGVAAGEWHLHAWDLARSAGRHHRPHDPRTVLAARAQLLHRVPPDLDGDPWNNLIVLSGRSG
jgi:Mycothiol maleylpyruvate isomerase N-terminal domain